MRGLRDSALRTLGLLREEEEVGPSRGAAVGRVDGVLAVPLPHDERTVMTTSLQQPAGPATGTTATSPVPAPRTAEPRPPRLAALTGAAFVVAVLTGNSLTESVSGEGVLGDLGALAASTAARSGLVVELVAFVLLLCFVGSLAGSVRRSAAAGVMAVAGTAMVAVKLGSAAAVLAALHTRDELDEVTATALVEENGAAFVLFWIPFGLFVAAAARVLGEAGHVGRVLGYAGLVLGTVGTVSGVLGAVWPSYAVPIPFLLSLIWVVAVSVRLAVGRKGDRRGSRHTGAPVTG